MEINMTTVENQKRLRSSLSPIVAGGVAAVVVVTVMYPMDCLKTRLQAAQGFQKAGGLRNLYKGVLILAAGSVPINSIFFGSYEAAKGFCEPRVDPYYLPVVHMFAATFCRALTSLIRVPTEVAKQRKQTNIVHKHKSAYSILVDAYRKEGLRRGVFRGFVSTILRDVPFSFIELPTWELLKATVKHNQNGHITSLQSAVCGLIAGGFAATVTTPLDLAKTRIMLADSSSLGGKDKFRISTILSGIYAESGFRGLFAGVTPRLILVMTGRFLFFGTYEEVKKLYEYYMDERVVTV